MGVFRVGTDVCEIDLELFDTAVLSCYLVADEEPTLVDTGTATSVEQIRAGLVEVGLELTDLEHAIVSHIHIDHPGGAHRLAELAPDLDVYVHELTVDHLSDPSG